MACETNLIQVGSCNEPSLVDNGNGTHTFDPGDGVVVTFPTSYLTNLEFDNSTRVLTGTMSNGVVFNTTIDCCVTIEDGTANDGLIEITYDGTTYTVAEGFTTITGPDINGIFTGTMPNGTNVTWSQGGVTTIAESPAGTFTATLADGSTIEWTEVCTPMLNVTTGPDNVVANATSTATIDCGETLHFWSSDQSVTIAVAEGSALVDLTVGVAVVSLPGAAFADPDNPLAAEVDTYIAANGPYPASTIFVSPGAGSNQDPDYAWRHDGTNSINIESPSETYTFEDTASVDMVTTGTVITANVKVSATAGNTAVLNADGVYVPDCCTETTVDMAAGDFTDEEDPQEAEVLATIGAGTNPGLYDYVSPTGQHWSWWFDGATVQEIETPPAKLAQTVTMTTTAFAANEEPTVPEVAVAAAGNDPGVYVYTTPNGDYYAYWWDGATAELLEEPAANIATEETLTNADFGDNYAPTEGEVETAAAGNDPGVYVFTDPNGERWVYFWDGTNATEIEKPDCCPDTTEVLSELEFADDEVPTDAEVETYIGNMTPEPDGGTLLEYVSPDGNRYVWQTDEDGNATLIEDGDCQRIADCVLPPFGTIDSTDGDDDNVWDIPTEGTESDATAFDGDDMGRVVVSSTVNGQISDTGIVANGAAWGDGAYGNGIVGGAGTFDCGQYLTDEGIDAGTFYITYTPYNNLGIAGPPVTTIFECETADVVLPDCVGTQICYTDFSASGQTAVTNLRAADTWDPSNLNDWTTEGTVNDIMDGTPQVVTNYGGIAGLTCTISGSRNHASTSTNSTGAAPFLRLRVPEDGLTSFSKIRFTFSQPVTGALVMDLIRLGQQCDITSDANLSYSDYGDGSDPGLTVASGDGTTNILVTTPTGDLTNRSGMVCGGGFTFLELDFRTAQTGLSNPNLDFTMYVSDPNVVPHLYQGCDNPASFSRVTGTGGTEYASAQQFMCTTDCPTT